MVCPTSGASIFFTIDGTEPTATSIPYDPVHPPRLYQTGTWKAVAIKAGIVSPISSIDYIAIPLFPDFDLGLAVGDKWDFSYTYYHYVAYSSSGDTTFTTHSSLGFILTDLVDIGGIPFYLVQGFGSQASRVKWRYLAWQDRRLLGSKDGQTITILFDSMLGLWYGQCFYATSSADGLLYTTEAGSDYSISTGWRYDDSETAYYPGVGTIYDPDSYSGFSQTIEKYRNGIGPFYWRQSSGTTTSTSSTTDTYTIELIGKETGVDPSPYRFDAEVVEHEPTLIQVTGSSARIMARFSSKYSDAICYVESLSGADPVLSVYSVAAEMAPLVAGADYSSGCAETVYIKNPGGDSVILVEGLPTEGCTLRFCFMKAAIADTGGTYAAAVPASSTGSLAVGSATSGVLGSEETVRLYYPEGSLGKGMYAFAIPFSPDLDLSIALVKPKTGTPDYTFVSTDRVRFMNDHAAGRAEALKYTKTSEIFVWSQMLASSGAGILADRAEFIFGWGLMP
jgi:hypothetical protein